MPAGTTLAPTPEQTPLADYLTGVLSTLHPLPALDLDLTQAFGTVLAADAQVVTPLPAFDHAAIDGFAARVEDLLGACPPRPIKLAVADDLAASEGKPVRLFPGACFAIAAGAALPLGADVVIPRDAGLGLASIEVSHVPKHWHGVRRAGEELPAGTVVAGIGTRLTPAALAVLAAAGVRRVRVRTSPRVAIIATGDELIDAGRPSQPGQVVDANSPGLVAAAAEAGAHAYAVGICPDDPDALRELLDDQDGRADLVVVTGGTGSGPGDMVRRSRSFVFTQTAAFPCSDFGFGLVRATPVVSLPGDPGAALIGFEVLVRPMICKLAGVEPVFRPSARATLVETLESPLGRREFRPAWVSERRGGGYTAHPLPGGPYTLSGLAMANALIVFGERVTRMAAGSTVDVLLLDR
jgi:molybdopterin molybdotransferase